MTLLLIATTVPAINIRRLQAIRISATRKIVLTYVRKK